MSEAKLLIPSAHIHLLDSVGQGEFGVVYRAHLTGWEGNPTAQVVAVKTLKCMLRYSMRGERVCYQLRINYGTL